MNAKKEKKYFLLPSLGGGGVEKIITSMSYYMNNYDIHFILFENDIKYSYKGTIHILDIEVGKKLNLIGKIKKFYLSIKKLKQFKKNHDVNVVMSFMPLANFLNIITRVDEKILISVRANPSLELNSLGKYKYIYKILTKMLYSKADKIIVISKAIKKDLEENFLIDKNKIEVIYNPIDIEKVQKNAFEKIDSKYEKIFKNHTLITVGRLASEKGQWHLIRIFSEIKKRDKNLKLIIIGEGPLKSQLIKQSKNYGLNTYDFSIDEDRINDNFDVYFLGFQKNPHKFIKPSTLFIFPSLYEGFGNVITEAMACGTSVVSSDCESGPQEILCVTDAYQEDFFVDYGVLLPTFQDSNPNNNSGFEKIDEIWINTITMLLNDKILREHIERKALQRIGDFLISKITPKYEANLLEDKHDK